MNTYTKLPVKSFYRMLIACAVIVFSISIQTMIQVKDVAFYNEWAKEIGTASATLQQYVSIQLTQFFSKVIVPMIFAVYVYFAYTRIRINHLFVFMWSVLLIGSFLFELVEWNFGSIFYYLTLMAYVILIYTILTLGQHIRDSKIERQE